VHRAGGGIERRGVDHCHTSCNGQDIASTLDITEMTLTSGVQDAGMVGLTLARSDHGQFWEALCRVRTCLRMRQRVY
jgi:hypothetical protein